MSKTQARWISFSGRTLAAVALFATGGFVLHAQSTQASGTQAPTVSAQEPILNLQTADSGQAYSSSDAEQVGTEIAANATKPFEFLNAMQYGGGRQRYGRPRYRGGNTNADGSPKYDFYVGGGFGLPVGDQSNYLTTGWGFQGGGGRMFNKLFGVNLEFAYDHFGMTSATINNQAYLYDPTNTYGIQGNLGANSHIWSFSLQPIVNVKTGEGLGAYVTGGFGFYHKVGNFTLPATGEECDYYYGCYLYTANENIDHYTSNAAGIDGGFGVTYKFSRFASERLYAEVRVVHTFNQYKPGVTDATVNTYIGYNYFPQNSQHTTYLPVKFGLRF
jgi:hypothetical protein